VAGAVDSLAGIGILDAIGAAFDVITLVADAHRIRVVHRAGSVTGAVDTLAGVFLHVLHALQALGVVARVAQANRRTVPGYSAFSVITA